MSPLPICLCDKKLIKSTFVCVERKREKGKGREFISMCGLSHYQWCVTAISQCEEWFFFSVQDIECISEKNTQKNTNLVQKHLWSLPAKCSRTTVSWTACPHQHLVLCYLGGEGSARDRKIDLWMWPCQRLYEPANNFLRFSSSQIFWEDEIHPSLDTVQQMSSFPPWKNRWTLQSLEKGGWLRVVVWHTCCSPWANDPTETGPRTAEKNQLLVVHSASLHLHQVHIAVCRLWHFFSKNGFGQ